MVSASNLYQSFFYVSKYIVIRETQLQKKLTGRLSPTEEYAFTYCMFSNNICNIILFVSIFSRIIRPKRTLGKTSPWIIQKSIKYCFCLSAFSQSHNR